MSLPHVSPIAHAVLSRLSTILPEAEALPPASKHGAVSVDLKVIHAGTSESYVVNLADVTVSELSKPGVPTSAALTVEGIARMLGVARKAGALADHVESAMLTALFASGVPDANDLARVEAIRAEASARLPARKQSTSVRLVQSKTAPAWHRVG